MYLQDLDFYIHYIDGMFGICFTDDMTGICFTDDMFGICFTDGIVAQEVTVKTESTHTEFNPITAGIKHIKQEQTVSSCKYIWY